MLLPLKTWRNGICYYKSLAISSTRLYVFEMVQFTTGLKEVLILWIFMITLNVGGVKMRLIYFNLTSLCIITRRVTDNFT